MTFTHMNKFASFQALNQPFPINLLYSLHVVVELSPKGTEALIKPQQLSAIGSFTLITQRKLVPKRIQKQKSLFTEITQQYKTICLWESFQLDFPFCNQSSKDAHSVS